MGKHPQRRMNNNKNSPQKPWSKASLLGSLLQCEFCSVSWDKAQDSAFLTGASAGCSYALAARN